MDPNTLIQQAEELFRERTRMLFELRRAKASIPAIVTQLDAAGHMVACAIECGFLSPNRIAEIRAALALADTYDNPTEQEERPTDDSNRP